MISFCLTPRIAERYRLFITVALQRKIFTEGELCTFRALSILFLFELKIINVS